MYGENVTVDLAIGMDGVGSSLLGALADAYGLKSVMVTLALALLPIPAVLLALRLPGAPTKKAH